MGLCGQSMHDLTPTGSSHGRSHQPDFRRLLGGLHPRNHYTILYPTADRCQASYVSNRSGNSNLAFSP